MEETKEEIQDDVADEGYSVMQAAVAIASSMIGELERANGMYPGVIRSSSEAAGILLKQHNWCQATLADMKVCDGQFHGDNETFVQTEMELKKRLLQIGAMCIKIAYSLCDFGPEIKAFSNNLGMVNALQEQADSLPDSDVPAES